MSLNKVQILKIKFDLVLNVLPNSKAMMYEENRNYIPRFSDSLFIVRWKVMKNISDEALLLKYFWVLQLDVEIMRQ